MNIKGKLILLDIDGTLTNSKKEITERTFQALMQAQMEGARLVLASGRPTRGLMHYAKLLKMDQHHGYLISYNGARVTDYETGEILFNQAMTVEEGKQVLKHMENFPEVRVMIDRGEHMYVKNVYDCNISYQGGTKNIMEYESRMNDYKLCEVDDLVTFADQPLNKILTFADPEYLQAHCKEMAAPFEGKLSHMFTSDFYYEFTAKGIDKANAMEHAFLPLGYQKEDMIAFGDGQNDAPMIQYAGIGVAMSNAMACLKEVADEITLSNEEDGIAESLYQHFPTLGK